ncbi:Rod shape-determining protein MreD [Magnetococcus marinus MC-1]|uniref:Rod shape-determining protein MreD n=1 Tax=Magnetococcus marinus (strain ATCC BAA-1437 / JCM 17883 / MC-1) TaxID=156889 RepID=A0L7I2_MAGMM|nr:rod shape-determining protein MreD [Magnetococcus marinus]ABK43925.1 Rod shape-determining protein MreD [Magnetococcus marinus MC-1]
MTLAGSLLAPWLPLLSLMLAVAVQEVALPYQAWSVFRPDLLLVALFYWRLYRPDRCGPGSAFGAGVAVDLLSGGPMGINALSKILITLLIRRFGPRLRATDAIFLVPILALLSLLDQMIQLGLATLVQGWGVRWPLLLGRVVSTALVAPLVVGALIHIHRIWLGETPRAGR